MTVNYYATNHGTKARGQMQQKRQNAKDTKDKKEKDNKQNKFKKGDCFTSRVWTISLERRRHHGNWQITRKKGAFFSYAYLRTKS